MTQKVKKGGINKMKWSFTPKQVIEGEVNYTLEEFVRELWGEVKSKISKEEFNRFPEGQEREKKYYKAIKDVFNFEYEICYVCAIKKPYLDAVIEQFNGEEKEIIKKTTKENKGNIDMLHALLVKHIANGRSKGLSKKQALKSTYEYSKDLISRNSYKT